MSETQIPSRFKSLKEETSDIWSATKLLDFIEGKILRIASVVTQQYGRKVVFEVDASEVVSDGKTLASGVYSVFLSAELRRAFYRRKYCVGDHIGILYSSLGGKQGNTKMFKIFVDQTPDSKPWVDPESDVPKVPDPNEPEREVNLPMPEKSKTPSTSKADTTTDAFKDGTPVAAYPF